MHIRADEFRIYYKRDEFRIAFAFYYPGGGEEKFDEVVICIPPEGVKRLVRELNETVKRYEKQWGKLEVWVKAEPKPFEKQYIT